MARASSIKFKGDSLKAITSKIYKYRMPILLESIDVVYSHYKYKTLSGHTTALRHRWLLCNNEDKELIYDALYKAVSKCSKNSSGDIFNLIQFKY